MWNHEIAPGFWPGFPFLVLEVLMLVAAVYCWRRK